MEDLIRRSDAIANIEILLDDISDIQDEDELKEIKAYNLGVWASLNSIKHHVPSADRLQRKWIKTDRTYCGSTIYKCSVCGADIDEMPTVMGVPKYKSCPYCGADMRGDSNE